MTIWKYLCCCCSCEEEVTSRNEDEERQRLFRNDSRRSDYGADGISQSQNIAANKSLNDGAGGLPIDLDDEQSILQRILQKTANDVIDVTTGHMHAVESHEYVDRAKRYGQKLCVYPISSLPKKPYKSLLAECQNQSQAEKVLCAPLLNIQDVVFIGTHCRDMARAIEEVKVEAKEDIVVQFNLG